MILNLKTFNGFLKFKHCKLESVEDALDLITEGSYFGSVKLKDASYIIPIHQNFTNGFSPVPRVFTNVLTPPFKYI